MHNAILAKATAAAPTYVEGTENIVSADLAGRLRAVTSPNLGVAGAFSGYSASASFTPAAAAYSAGDLMDVAKQMAFTDANGLAIPSASLIRVLTTTIKIDVTAVPSGQTNYTLHCYSVTPPSAQVDNDAWTLASGDLASYLGSINLGTPADLGAALYVKAQYIDFDMRLAGTSIYGVLVTAGAHTAEAVARQVRLHAVVL